MMIAVLSDAFIGTRISTMAKMIGMIRVMLGKDPATNYVYVGRDYPGAPLKVCEECIFLCDETRSRLCGDEPLYS